jgi:palmitoyl-protein thioesterase
MYLAASDPNKMSKALSQWAQDLRLQVPVVFDQDSVENLQRKLRGSKNNPTVLSHGMGDSCYNSGMQSITNRVESLTHQYATCVPTGDNLHEDTLNGYFKSMLDNVDIFAERVRSDPKLTNGFNAIGFSQGNNIIRGYIAKYNDPPVKTFISVNGVNGGISAVPFCIPSFSTSLSQSSSRICDALMEMASHRAYSDFSQVCFAKNSYERFH